MYIDSVMNYTGSKFKLLEQILPEMDYSKKYFVDLFTGGGSVFINVLDKYDKILVNDIISDLIGIHKKLLESDDIINDIKKISIDKSDDKGFYDLRESYNRDKSPEKLWALMLSSTNNMMRFNQKFEYNQSFGKRSLNDNILKKIDLYKNHVRKYRDKIHFTSKNFYDIDISKPSMVYLDPPYSQIKNDDGTPSNKKISEAGYNCYYSKEDDIRLYNYCKDLDDRGSSFMLSGVLYHNGNTSWLLDKLINDGFKYRELDYNYNKVSRKDVNKNTMEIIVKNY